MIYEQKLAAVDPIQLAIDSGATKARRFAATIPPVATPFLLTGQLRRALGQAGPDFGAYGSCCGSCADGGMAGGMIPPDYGTLRGLGVTGCPTTYNPQNLGVPSMGTGNISILQSVANTAATGASFIPGVGTLAAFSIKSVTQMLTLFESWFGIGAGRREADLIVPVQNQLMAHLGTITNQILVGTTPGISDLITMYRDVWASFVAFQEFVLMCNFTDRRASGQALNTVMPYADGSCGYSVPVGPMATPTQFNCLSWGDGTLGGAGTNGMLGAIARAIQNAGGTVPTLPDLHQTANQGIKPNQITGGPGVFGLPATIMGVSTPLALVGIAALFLYSRRAL